VVVHEGEEVVGRSLAEGLPVRWRQSGPDAGPAELGGTADVAVLARAAGIGGIYPGDAAGPVHLVDLEQASGAVVDDAGLLAWGLDEVVAVGVDGLQRRTDGLPDVRFGALAPRHVVVTDAETLVVLPR
jgi:hypothetical protein